MSGRSQTMTVDELAILLGVSKRTVYRALDAGQIPAVRVGQRWILYRPRITRWLDGDQPDGLREVS